MKTAIQKAGVTLVAGLLLAVPAIAQGGSGIAVTVNCRPVNFPGQGPIQSGGRVLVPLRGVLEKLGAYVSYDSARREVRAVRNEAQIVLPIGANAAQVDGRSVALDAPARIVNGSTMVPLRFVAEALGARVDYQADTSTVAISSGVGRDTVDLPRTDPPLPADAGRVVRATIIDVRPNGDSLRIQDAEGRRRTVTLAPDFQVRRRTADGFRTIGLGRLLPGDVVSLEMRDGAVRTVTVLPGRTAAGF